jgi:hypothetical protein
VGGVYLALGRIDEAIEGYRTADQVARTLNQPWAMGAAANSLGRALVLAESVMPKGNKGLANVSIIGIITLHRP